MGKKREDEIISFQLFKETVMMICMLIPFILYQYDLLSLFHLVLLGVLILDKLFLRAGKRKKTRTPGKSFSNWISRKRRLLNLNGTYTVISGYGKERLFVSTEEIAKGSNETVIFEGEFQGRRVAVKRLLKDLHFVALKEVQHLIASDQHPNIVRFHGVKYDKDYVYLALEHCICSLTDLISLHADSLQNSGPHQAKNMQNVNLWKSSGYPSALLLKLMRDMVNGIVHLHDLGIIHQDIKPQNVMIANGNGICAKLSDIGISRSDKSSSPQNAADGSEQKFRKRQRCSADMYSLGCIFYFCLTRGGHPFDHQLNHDIKFKNNRVSLHLVDHIPEAVDLLSRLLHSNPAMRPKAFQVLHHPLFWDSEKRLSFLRDVSDRLKRPKSKGTKRQRQHQHQRHSNILIALERVAKRTFGDGWDKIMESELIKDINCRPYGYKYNSVQHLLRVVRNKLNHYHESPPEIKELLGPMPEGIDNYFSCRFPRLLMEVYEVVISNFRLEKCFEKYFGDE